MTTYFCALKKDNDKIRTAFFACDTVDHLPPKEAISEFYPIIWDSWVNEHERWNTLTDFNLENLNPNNDGTHQKEWDLAIAFLDKKPEFGEEMEFRSGNVSFYFLQ